MSSLKRIFGNTLAYGIIPKIPTLINVILLPIITPYLTLDDYGIWGVVSAYCELFLCIAPLGLHIHLTNLFFEVRNWRIYWGHIFFLMLFSGIICSTIYICVILIELDYVPFWTRTIIALCSCCRILFFGTSTISSQLYPLLKKPLPLVLRNLVASISAISVTFIVVYYFRLGYWGWILGSLTSSVISFILFGYILIKKERIYPLVEHKLKRIKNWLKISLPAVPHAIGFMLLASSSRIIMSFYDVPLEDVGIFSNGYTMGDYVTIVSYALATALSPEIQRAYREERSKDFKNIYYFCQIIAIILVFWVSCWMPDIYKLIMRNPNLQLAAPIASLICYANVLNPLYTFLAVVVFITKQTKQLLWLVFLPGIINVSCCLIFIPIYGYTAAVYSTIFSYWSMILIPFISSYHKTNVIKWLGKNYKTKLIVLLIILVFSLCLSQYISHVNIYLKIVITFTVGLSVLYFIGKTSIIRSIQ